MAVWSRERIEWGLLFIMSVGLLAAFERFDLAKQWNALYYDILVRQIQVSAGKQDNVLIIAIDDRSVTRLGQWPWPRKLQAQLVDELSENDPRSITLDIIYAEPEEGDPVLANSLAQSQASYLPMVIETPGPNNTPFFIRKPVDVLSAAATNLGHVNIMPDNDGIIRHVDRHIHIGNQAWPHLGLVIVDHNREDAGDRPLLAYAAGPGGFATISASAVIAGEVPREVIAGRDILVGATAAGLGDRFATPFGREAGLMKGVELLANALIAERYGYWARPLSPLTAFIASLVPIVALWLAFTFFNARRTLLVATSILAFQMILSALLLWYAYIWYPPMAAAFIIMISTPVWGWRRLAQIGRRLNIEIASLSTAIGDWDQPSAPAVDPLDKMLRLLRQGASHLSRSHQALTQLIQHLPNPTIVIAHDGTITQSNRKAKLVWRKISSDGMLLTLSEAFAQIRERLLKIPEDHEIIETAIATGQHENLNNLNLSTVDDRHFLLSATLMQEPNGKVFTILSFAEVTLLRQAMRESEQALQFLSHDLRSPIAATITYLNRIPDVQRDPWSEKARQSARYALEMAESYVRLAKAEDQTYHYEGFDLSGCAEEAIDSLIAFASEREVTLVYPQTDEVIVYGHRPSIQRAIENFVRNAILHASVPGDEVAVKIDPQKQGITTIRIEDRDRGNTQDVAELVARYSATRRISGGIGLGLAFCVVTAQKHGGTIFTSNHTNGKTVHFNFRSGKG